MQVRRDILHLKIRENYRFEDGNKVKLQPKRDKDREKLQFFVDTVVDLINFTFNFPFIGSVLPANQ